MISPSTFYWVYNPINKKEVVLNFNFIKEAYAEQIECSGDNNGLYRAVYVLKDDSIRYCLEEFDSLDEAEEELSRGFL